MNSIIEEKSAAAWARILPFLRPIDPPIQDPDISDIMVNGDGAVFIEKHGEMALVAGVTVAEKFLQVAARNIARALAGIILELGISGTCFRINKVLSGARSSAG